MNFHRGLKPSANLQNVIKLAGLIKLLFEN